MLNRLEYYLRKNPTYYASGEMKAVENDFVQHTHCRLTREEGRGQSHTSGASVSFCT
jgi:hypothetical protein